MEKKNEDEKFLESVEKFAKTCGGALLAFGVLVAVAVYCVCLGGCATTRTRGNAGDIRLTDSFILGGLENAVSDFDDGIGRAVRESRGIADEIDRLEFLFDRYEQQALRLRDEVNRLRAEIENKSEDNLDSGNSRID